MCGHSASANKIIQQLLHELYPAIQHQFVLIGATGGKPNHQGNKVNELITALKNEFQSLLTYENKLVFSSVLKVFNSQSEDVSHLPDIEEIQQLTRHKEQRIAEFISGLEKEVQSWTFTDKQPILQLISLFKNDFAAAKQRWNNMITNWLTSCNCFKRISNKFRS